MQTIARATHTQQQSRQFEFHHLARVKIGKIVTYFLGMIDGGEWRVLIFLFISIL